MSENGAPHGAHKNQQTQKAQTISLGTWTVSVSRKDKTVSIVTNDYHPDPLVITRDDLIAISRLMGLKVRKRNRKKKPIS
jgi:hypothetical protein